MKDNLNAKIKIGKTRNLIFSSVNSSKFKNFKSYLNKTEKLKKILNFTNDFKTVPDDINNQFIYLDNQFKNFKFLFFEKNETKNTLVFNDRMQFKILKNKVKVICEKHFSRILVEFTEFNLKYFYIKFFCFNFIFSFKNFKNYF